MGSLLAVPIVGRVERKYLVSNVFSNGDNVYLAESCPTAIRGTAAGAAYSLSKLVTGALPFLRCRSWTCTARWPCSR